MTSAKVRHVDGVAKGRILPDAASDETVLRTDILGIEDALESVDLNVGGDDDVFLDISLSSDALGTVGIYDGSQFAIVSLGTSSVATGRLDGDIVCDADPNQGSGGTGTGATGDTGAPPVETGDDTGSGGVGTVLLSGAGGCATTPVGWAPWLVVAGLLLPRRRRRA
ncbi:MAG: hypothetical protein AAF211_14370, partial [Myxococcota bacterium]